VCWKTGTSTGNHDAWAFVFNRHYVVGVWLGNNDAKASKYLVGARAALPLAARIFRALPRKTSPDWPDSDGEMREAKLCADSGLPASRWCPHTTTATVPAWQYLNRRCDVHYPLASNDDKLTQRWPASARGWDLAKVNATVNLVSGDNSRKEGLRILAPANNSEFVLAREPNADRIRLRSSADDSAEIHWYLDGQHLGATGPSNRLFLDMTEGEHRLSCMAPSGTTDSVVIIIDAPQSSLSFKTASRN
jgi:penicillin-binding protein 1C